MSVGGLPSRTEHWRVFSRALGRKPLLTYLVQPAPAQPAPTSAQPAQALQQPQPAVPTSISAQAPKQPAQAQPAPQPAPTASQAQPASQQPAPTQQQQAKVQAQQPAQAIQQVKRIAERFRFRGSTRIDECPRCGREGYEKIYTRKSKRGSIRKYVYVYHHLPNGKYYACYIGPLDNYVHVQKIHGNLALTHLRETNYARVIAHAAEKYIQQLQRVLEQQSEQGRKSTAMIHDIINVLVDLAEFVKESCETLGEHSKECMDEIKEVLSCSSS